MPEYRWIDISDRHPGAYRAEGIDLRDCRVELIWTLNPGIKNHNEVTATLRKDGGSLWRVKKRFERHHSAFHFFERMRGQAEIRLTKLTGNGEA